MKRKVFTALAIATACLVALAVFIVSTKVDTSNTKAVQKISTAVVGEAEKAVQENKSKESTEQERATEKVEEETESNLESTEQQESDSSDYIPESEPEEHYEDYEEYQAQDTGWSGEVLTASGGVANGPSGVETYYNLPMGGVVDNMRNLGYSEEEYPYWVRDDGCKMLGDYIIVAADFDVRPEGTIVETSLGTGIVCDTGSFADYDPYQLDVAVSW